MTKNRWSTAKNAPTTEGQTWGITWYTTLVVRGTMFDSQYLGALTSELQNFAAVHRTFCVHQMCEKWPKSLRRKLVVFEVKVPGKIKIAEIVVRGTMFDSAYLGPQSSYLTYFRVVDSPPTLLQVDQKSSVYGWKCRHYRRSNLRDPSKLSCEGPYLTPHISAVNRVIRDILHQSIVCQNVYKVSKNCRSTAENAPTTEGQTL